MSADPIFINGEFLIKIEVEGNEKSKRQVFCVTLNQHGNKVCGEIMITRKGITLIIDGEVSSTGNFNGFYYKKGDPEHCKGSFSLYSHVGNEMFGEWSGYDVINKKEGHGKCLMVPVLKNFKVKLFRKCHFSEIIALSDEELGEDYLTQELLNDFNSNENAFVHVALNSSGKVIGFVLGLIASENEIQAFFKKAQLIQLLRLSLSAGRIGIVKTIAINNKYKGQGVGTALIKSCISILETKGISIICSLAWRSKKGINLEHILENEGFKILKELKKYWFEDSIQRNYICPECGQPPCKCSAVIYYRYANHKFKNKVIDC